jgi:uncharacterized membrane protein YeaQ/YmgE (transglycosylase-associated protein family)
MFGVIGWIVFGLIVGVIAKLLMPGRDPGGFIVTALLGIAGALLGGWIGRFAGLYRPGEAAGLIMSILGAIVLLVLYRRLQPARPV